jgi:hypothetical protein
MSIEELKKELTSLSPAEQTEVTAFLFHLRHRSDPAYQETLAARFSDDPSRWLKPEDFEKELDKK